ncbi:MAG: deoxyribodipyrimidine photo-lyase [Bacteroidetes bacterium]|nr:MAG: deoxyribodipyrimidine photo-lyase [Bacteroidota bacterium]
MQVNIFWFRRDLRLFDNHGLFRALKSGKPVLPIFIFDKKILGALPDKNDRRVSFIYDSLKKIQEQLIQSGSSLHLFYDTPLNAFKNLAEEYRIGEVFTNHDYEPYAIKRDEEIFGFLKERGIRFSSYKDQVIFEKREVLKPDGKPYTIFTPYSKTWKAKLRPESLSSFPSEENFSSFLKTRPLRFHSLKELGFNHVDSAVPGTSIDPSIVSNYHNTRNIPSVNGTSRLSVHLRFGTVSIRQLLKAAAELNEQWLNELIWREFFMMILFHFPDVVACCFKPKYNHIEWRNNEKEFELWCKGETGYPIVDAGMRELNETGYMHNRVRMVVASFLTKHLLIDWRWGEAYFAEKLLDFELSSNNGNWQWAAGCGCDAAPYFRVFNPSEQTKKFDPDLIYIKKWVKDFKPGYLPLIVEHDFARKRALEVYKQSLNEEI